MSTQPPRLDIGFVGLGAMGAPIASRLAANGPIAVFDTRAEAMAPLVERGAVGCGSPAEVADVASTVFVSLPTPSTVLAVVEGPGGLLEGSAIETFVDLSTSGPTVSARIADLLAARAIRFLDAPVSGGVAGAEAGKLTIMAAGPEDLFDDLRPHLDQLGSKIILVGERPGQGQLAKLLNNMLSATAIAATAEALAMGVRGGLDAERLLDVINSSSGRSAASADKFPRFVLPRTFDFGFRLALMAKDVGLCVQEASQQGTPMVLGSLVSQLWQLSAVDAEPDADCTEITKMFEQWAGVVIGDTGDDRA